MTDKDRQPQDTETAGDGAAPEDAAEPARAGEQVADEADRAEKIAAELAETKEQLLRTLAEIENVRKRSQREVEEARKYAVTNFARDMLEVSDNLDRALEAIPAEARGESGYLKTVVEGLEMTRKTLAQSLEKQDVRQVTPEPGEKFDHKLHQAMFEMPTDAHAPGTVAEVMQSGYVIADRLLRPALVGVAKAPPAADDAASGRDGDNGGERGGAVDQQA